MIVKREKIIIINGTKIDRSNDTRIGKRRPERTSIETTNKNLNTHILTKTYCSLQILMRQKIHVIIFLILHNANE